MTRPEADEPPTCLACGIASPVGAVRCFVCLRAFAEAPPMPARRLRTRSARWADAERAPTAAVPLVAGIVAIAGLFAVARGLGVLVLLCAAPVLVLSRQRGGLSGCLLAGSIAAGLIVASAVAFFLTCTFLYRRAPDAALGVSFIVMLLVFLGLTALSIAFVKSSERRLENLRRKEGLRLRSAPRSPRNGDVG